MKKNFNLPATLGLFFGAARVFILVATTLVLFGGFVQWMRPSRLGSHRHIGMLFENVALVTPAGSLAIKSTTSHPADIQLHRLTSDLNLNLFSADPELAAAIRCTLLPSFIVSFVASFLILGLLRGLCRRFERGEVFSENNLRSVRHVGALLVINSLVGAALGLWTTHHLGGYLATHGTVSGIDATLDASFAHFQGLPSYGLITGLLVLLVAETFRQGLALQKENELTV